MAFTVSVRDLSVIEHSLRSAEPLLLPEECKRNRDVLYVLLQGFAHKVVPGFANLGDPVVESLAGGVAYLMRTDIIRDGEILLGAPLIRRHRDSARGDIRILNDPSVLSPEWRPFWRRRYDEISNTHAARGAELFRCYGGVLDWMPDSVCETIQPGSGSMQVSFSLADLTSYLLHPHDIRDYRYSTQEIDAYRRKVAKEWSEV